MAQNVCENTMKAIIYWCVFHLKEMFLFKLMVHSILRIDFFHKERNLFC